MDPSTNTVELNTQQDSKITNVNLYSGRAEVTRLFSVSINAGSNNVIITGLPYAFQQDSLRVEGRGNATIHDVIIERIEWPRDDDDSEETRLRTEYRSISYALNGATHSKETLRKYLSTISAVEFDVPRLEVTLQGYMDLHQTLNKRIYNLQKDLAVVGRKINQIEGVNKTWHLSEGKSWKASINVHGQVTEEIQLLIKYAVYGADWTASYDIRVDTQAAEKKIIVLYKAIVSQNTGEPWNNVPLTLETASPSFGIEPPNLLTWRINSWKAPTIQPQTIAARNGVYDTALSPQPNGLFIPSSPCSYSTGSPRPAPPPIAYLSDPPPMIQQPMIRGSDKGHIVATFRIPGSIDIPNDGGKHNVTVAQLNLDAALMWYIIPRVDTRVHMKAKIRNNSDFAFVPGSTNIYVDGSFIATTTIPSVSPGETFNCPLGLDSTIRVTYHPVERKATTSGFYSKTWSDSFIQRITVLNTKLITVKNLKVIDQIPVSEDERIEIKLLAPALTLPGQSSKKSALKPVQVAPDVVAQWNGTYEDNVDQECLGRDGKCNWIVSILPQKSVSLTLHCETSYPKNMEINHWYEN